MLVYRDGSVGCAGHNFSPFRRNLPLDSEWVFGAIPQSKEGRLNGGPAKQHYAIRT